jgi:hypothetical protein
MISNSTPAFTSAIAAGTLKVVGGIYDLPSGKVNLVPVAS